MANVYFNLNQIQSNPDGQPTVKRQSRLTSNPGEMNKKEQLSRDCLRDASESPLRCLRYLSRIAMIFCVLAMSVGQAWGASGDVLFNQGFGSATAVAYSANTARSYSTSSTLSGLVGTGDNLFQGAQCTQKTNCGIAINTTSGANSYTTAGTFQAYANNTSFKWALYKTTNFATTAPTAIKFEMDVTPKYIDNKQALAVVVGSGFSVGTSKPAWAAGYTGFNIITNSTKTGKIYIGKVGGTTSIQETTGMTSGTNYHITWVINATGDDLTYTGPDSKSYTLATAKWDMWVGTTRIISGQDRTKTGGTDFSGTTMQNLYIGNDVSGKHEVIIDNVKVTDLTPSCDAADLTASNITSNGNQEAGTGITFSKVGTPASGDTWYWQTSATGTDKTYNATSPYTTATTAGSYTVYLRAFNTDCWGEAASMTNTIYPAPSAMIHNTFAVNDAWSSTIATQDKTNITSLNAMAAVGESVGSGSNKSGLTQKIPSQLSEDASKYMSLSFNVASGKQLNVTSVVFDEQPVTGTGTFKVSISDNQGSTTKTQTIASDAAGSKHTLTLDGDIVGSFKGTVTVKVWAYGWGEGYRFGNYFYINGTVTTTTPSCTAPNHVDISGNYHFFPGETLALTATAYSTAGTSDPIAAGDITGYQWQKYIGSDWEDIVGETSATYTKANATTSDVGQYRCIVSTGATCSTTSDTFNAKCLQLYVYWDNKSDKCNLPFTKVDGTQATVNVSLENGSYTYYYKVTDGCGNWWGNTGTMTSSNCSGWNLNVNSHCGLTTTKAAAYTFNLTYNAGVDAFSMSVVYPSSVQVGGYNLYFANDERNWSNIHYRIGRSNWNSKAAMTLVPGTANLYQTTTIHYESDGGFEAWHIANNGGWSDGNSIYKTKTGDGNAITNATSFEGAPVPSTGLTVIPGSDHSTGGDDQNNNCEFYSYTSVPGMLRDRVTITAPVNGTITVNYTSEEGVASSFSATTVDMNQDLAHTVIITPTATPAEGYTLSGLTVNGAAHTSGNTYTVTANTTIAATFSPASYTVTLNTNGGTINAGNVTSYTYGTGATLPTNVTKDGYTFDGWFDNSGLTGDAVTSISSSATGNKEFWAKWTCVTPTFGTNLSTSTVNYNVGAAASALTVAATAGGGTVTYQWYKNTANSTTTPTPTALTTGASYTPSTAATGTTYYFCVATNSTAGCSTTATSNITPVTVAATYTVTYQYNGATSGASPASATGASVTLPTPTRTGYVLDGWYKTDGTKVGDGGDTYNPTADVTLYARWETACAGGSSTATFNFNSGNSTGLTIENSQASWSYNIVNSTTNTIPVLDSYFLALSFASTSTGTITVTTNDSYASIDSIKFNSASTDNSNPKVAIFTVAGSPETETSRLSAIAVSSGTTKTWRATPYKLDLSATKPTGKVRFKFTTGSSGKYAGFDNIQIFYGAGSGTCYSVKYCGNGATSGYVSDPTSYAANDDPVVLGNVGLYPFVRAGYTFTGWNTEAGGGGTAYAVGATITDISADVTLYAQWTPTVNYSVTHTLTNVTATSGATGASAATGCTAYNATFEAAAGYNLPSTITVTIGGSPATETTDYTWNSSTGALEILAASVTGNIVITIAGETAPATKDIYYGAITITAGALTKGSTGTSQFFTNIGGTIANNTEISWSSGPGTGGEYYESNVLTDTELSKSSNWNTSSGSNRYVGGMKFQSGSTYTLALGSKVASSITFYGRNGSASKTMTIGGEDWTSSATKNTFAKHEFIKTGGFTGNVSITQDGDFYGILVITIQTATPCTTPVIPTLSNQTVCPGSDIAAWNATQTAVLADGETASYSWKKKGNDTEIEDEATLDLGAATESMAGTYVVTVTVSKAGKASSSASKEVTLTVTAAVEEPVITANKATVYPGNSVTLTATCGTDGVTWNWYLCANADGTGAGSSLGTSSSYTIASAGAAGTYYYKAVATGSCGTAERVYTLTVTAASECEKYFWFVYAADATTNGVVNNRDGFFTGAPTGSSNSSTYKFTLDGTEYTATKNTGSGSFSMSFTIPEGSTATMGINCKGSSSKPLYLTHSSGTPQKLVSNSSSNASCTVENITEGTWTLTSAGSWTLAALGVQVCTTSTCTDATPTITAANTTVCVGSELSISSTGYETGATFQWQKLNNSTSTWDNISGATSATYTATAAAEHAGSYRLVATKGCARTSNTVTISVPSAPNFGSTVPASVSVMQTIALSINTVEATDAVKYRWYKSADATWDAGDTEIGTNKELIKAYDGEAIGSPSYYIFCRAQNACGITTSTAIAVNVTAYVEEDCATRGNEGDAEFGFQNSGCSQGTYNGTAVWSTGTSNSKILIYSAPDDKYFKTMKVTIASSSATKASYNWSTNGGSSYTADGVAITGVTTTLTEKTIDLSAHGNVNEVKIGRNFGNGESSGTLYVSKICFEYTSACTATTVTPSTSSVINYEMGGEWSNPTFTLTPAAVSGETLTYSSSNEDIASVDDDGTVTFNGEAGTVTITASYAGGTISATEYCASSGSYTINVSCPGGAPKVVADGSVDMSGCNSSVTLHAKKQDGTAFDDGTYQWFRNGEEIDGATGSSYTATQAGTYTVERTNGTGCTTPSTNSAVVTSETTEPEVERLVPFQYYHVDKTYSDQMKMRHLFAVKNSGTLDGKHFKMYVSRNGGAAADVTSSNALVVWPSDDGPVDTVMVDLNKLSGKYSENDELVYTCKAIDCSGNVSEVYKNTITINVIGATPTLALICSGSSKAGGTRKTGELTVGGDFLTGYNVADLCQQTGNTSFDANTEWGLYTDLKTQYIVTPVNGYAVFNKLNYEPFDILLLTDYPKASKSDAAKDVLDDMAALCDYRPMLSFKTHMVAKSPSKWAAKGFTTSATENKEDGRLNLNIVCYAHPMFEHLKDGANVYRDADNSSELVYTMLSGTGYESNKGMQGFEIDAAENFVTIGLTHYNASAAPNTPSTGNLRWTPNSGDRMLVTVAERQTNIEARFILFSINCGAQSKLTAKGEEVILACLEYLLDDDPLHVADCSFTFDNGANAPHDAEWYKDPAHCPGCSGTLGDGLWSTEANWGPERINIPEEFTSARIAAPVTVDLEHAKAMELRIIDEGSIDIPAGKALDVKSTIRRMDGSEIYPTEIGDIHIGSASTGNGTLIFNNNSGDTKARVDMYSNAQADMVNMSAATSKWQYIGTPHSDVASATHNYYDSWLYQYSGSGWEVIPNGGPLVPFRGYCVTHPDAPVVFGMEGTLVATTAQDIAIPAGYTVIANSWTAPIDINAITNDDMENISEKTIYFFNTGSDPDKEGELDGGDRWAAGTYVSVPIHSAPYTGDDHIPSMQGFYVWSETAGTLHLDYEKHVRGTTRDNILSGRMHAPRRTAAESDEPNVLKIFARGSRYDDRLIVLEREDFTRGYDSGWDGEAWGGSNLSPMVYVTGEGREDAVSAIPEFEGTVVAFKAGEDSEYRFEFTYSEDAEPLYLFDTENNTYTQIMTGESYYFSTDDKAPHSRFILTRKAPQIATGVEPTSDGEGAKARKLLIEDKMYILLNGMLYDATGKVVK